MSQFVSDLKGIEEPKMRFSLLILFFLADFSLGQIPKLITLRRDLDSYFVSACYAPGSSKHLFQSKLLDPRHYGR